MNRWDDEGKGIIWKLPEIKTRSLGKLGPGFGVGAGCGFGFAFGLIGGAGFGLGIPSMQLGFGFGAGCGIGVGFGYGFGKGIAYDHSRKYSNVEVNNLSYSRGSDPSLGDIGPLIDELVVQTKKLVEKTSQEISKWGRD